MYTVRMPFGKHKGKDLGEVPFGYLSWVVRELTDLDPWLRRAIRAELERRVAPDERHAGAPFCPRCREIDRVLKRVLRKAALDLHPDRRGGDAGPMKGANHVMDLLQAELSRAG